VAFAVAERGADAYNQQLAQVTVSRLGDAPEPRPGRAPWRQAEEGGPEIDSEPVLRYKDPSARKCEATPESGKMNEQEQALLRPREVSP
jgi:hypothetical protein